MASRRTARVRRRAPRPRGLGRLFVVFVLLAVGLVYLQLEKKVTLVVDGDGQRVSTFASSVGDLLEGNGIEIGKHDEVAPSLGAPVTDDMTVEVLLAKEITLVLNGKPRTLYVTGRTVEDVLQHVNLRSANRAYVRPSRGASISDGDRIVLREAVEVRVKVDGTDRQVITNAPDVGYLLVSMGVILRQDDEVTPSLERRPSNGMAIQVTRVTFKRTTVREQIAFQTEERYSDEYVKGVTHVEREGSPGSREKVFRLRMEDGREAARTLVSETVLEQPVSRIVIHGTRDPNVQHGLASWYHRDGMTAAHRTLPFGTLVKVTNLANGKSVWVTIDDRGPFIDGRIIDLSDDAFAQLAPLGSGTFNARISW